MKITVYEGDGIRKKDLISNKSGYIKACTLMSIMFVLIFSPVMCLNSYAEDMFALIEKQRSELVEKDDAVKKEIERLKVLKKEIDEDIAKYTRLLKQVEKSLERAEATGNKRLRHVAKAYEAMQPEDAASRLSGLEQEIAVQILLKMNSKKAGLVIGMMAAKKAVVLTKEIAKLKK